MDGERKARKKFSPTSLSIGQFGGVAKDFEVLVVGKDFELVGATFKVVSPFTKSFDDGEKLSIVDIVVSFSFNK